MISKGFLTIQACFCRTLLSTIKEPRCLKKSNSISLDISHLDFEDRSRLIKANQIVPDVNNTSDWSATKYSAREELLVNAKSWQGELLWFLSNTNNETGLLYFTTDWKLWTGEFFKILQDTFSFVTVIWKMRRRSAVVVVMIMNGSFVWKKNCLKKCPSLFVCKKNILKDGTTEVLISWPGMQISQLSLELSVYHLRWEIGELFIWRRKRFCIPVLIYRFVRVYDTKWPPSD